VPRFADEEHTLVGDTPTRDIPPRPPRPAAIEQIRGPGAPRVHQLEQPEQLIGRGQHANISIDSASVSREHLRLIQRDEEWSFLDLDSANGVFLNGVLAHAAVLRDGDILEFGEVACRFHERGL
jgi:pSer/pThr/pTyr-binding forkhead associated (FHA) protein